MQEPRASAPSARWSSDRRRLFGTAAIVWLGLGAVRCAQVWVLQEAAERNWTLGAALLAVMPWWVSWLALTPVIAILVERFPFGEGRSRRALVAHILAALVIASVQLPIVGAVYWVTTGQYLGVATSLANQIQRFYGNFFLESVKTYAAAAGVLIAIDFARGLRAEVLARTSIEVRAMQEMRAANLKATKARLDALASELNPHFVFNTLSAISGLIAQDRGPEARQVVQHLGEILRHTLAGDARTAVRDEISTLEDYLFIQKIRFSDRLRIGVTVSDEARDCLIPSLLIQPLVENAIRHGIEPGKGGGSVDIRVERDNGLLRVSVSDSGGGFAFGDDGRLRREGIGLSNTRARLHHMYADRARLVLRNRDEGGAEAVVELPSVESVTS